MILERQVCIFMYEVTTVLGPFYAPLAILFIVPPYCYMGISSIWGLFNTVSLLHDRTLIILFAELKSYNYLPLYTYRL